MPNIFFQGAELRISSGEAGTLTALAPRTQSISVSYQIPRQNITNLGRFKPLVSRPVVNFTPVQISFDYIKSDNTVENFLGIANPTGLPNLLSNSESVNGYGLRNLEVVMSPTVSATYAGQIQVWSGCLQSYSMSASVGEPARANIAMEALDMTFIANTSGKATNDYSANIVKPENISISGIYFSGLGISSIITQSVSLSMSINRAATFRLGRKYPERPITEVNASLQLNGFVENINAFTGMATHDCGNPLTGVYYITLLPSCSNEAVSTYVIRNPYLDSFNFSNQVGNFASVDLSFSLPLSILASETGQGSNITLI